MPLTSGPSSHAVFLSYMTWHITPRMAARDWVPRL